jgi:predicted Zn finger-like uncharacterized protein
MNRGNPYGFGLILVGAVMVAVSTFLPLVEPTGLLRFVQQNTLIQHGGWFYLVGAVGLAGAAFRGFLNRKDWYNPLIISVVGVIGIVIWAQNNGLRTLYPVGADGAADATQNGTIADWGISIYVAGFGVLLGIVGSLTLRQATDSGTKKNCPDCAETVLADAQVCKHCGFRFPIDESPIVEKLPNDRKVKCGNCSTVVEVPFRDAVMTTKCPECQTTLTIPPKQAPTKG